MYICIYVYMYICIYVYVYICIYVYMYICIYVYMYICICIYIYMCTHMRCHYAQIYMYVGIQSHKKLPEKVNDSPAIHSTVKAMLP